MGSFQATADADAAEIAGRKVGLYDELPLNALVAYPGAVWDLGVAPTSLTDTKWAVRNAMTRVGVYAEMGDHFYAKVATGMKGVINVPSVVGAQLRLAEKAIVNSGARVGTVTYGASAEPKDEVLTQSKTGVGEAGNVCNLTISDESL
jgi:hypothetical protein